MAENLEEAIQAAGGPLELLWDSHSATALAAGVPGEYSNWRDEQLAWRNGAALFDQSHHMSDTIIKGKDTLRLISDLAINSFENFPVDVAKQFVAVNADGYLIGDCILFHLAVDEVQMVGTHPTANWVQYQAEIGGYEVEITRDDDSTFRAGDPLVYRYQVQGPRAMEVIARAIGTEPPAIKFFHMTHFTIGGRHVRALRHGMVGTPGFELFGPWEDNDAVVEALLEAGREVGLTRVGAAAYHTTAIESGWLSRPVPAIYTGDGLAAYRKWLPADSYEGTSPLGGSLRHADIENYYLTPFDVGYGRIVSFSHEYIGRSALERMVSEGRDQLRRKVTLVWNGGDVEQAVGTMFHEGVGAKFIKLPLSRYADFQHDQVFADGQPVGSSGIVGYSSNFRSMLSLAVVDASVATPGTEVEIIWGEEPNSKKLQVERHRQVTLRATVQAAPIDEYTRTTYRQD